MARVTFLVETVHAVTWLRRCGLRDSSGRCETLDSVIAADVASMRGLIRPVGDFGRRHLVKDRRDGTRPSMKGLLMRKGQVCTRLSSSSLDNG